MKLFLEDQNYYEELPDAHKARYEVEAYAKFVDIQVEAAE